MNESEPLRVRIAERIERNGTQGRLYNKHTGGEHTVRCLSFYDYMDMCLYDEKGGYYRSGEVRVGKTGDFYTSSHLGSVMGDKLAEFIAGLAESFGKETNAAEWGAGTGRLSRQMLAAWKRTGHMPLGMMHYTVVDANPVHLAAAQSLLEPNREELGSMRFMSPAEAEAANWRSGPLIVVANELLDAFPVHRVVKLDGRLWELGVASTGGGSISSGPQGAAFQYACMPLTDPDIEKSLSLDGVELQEGQEAEVNLAAERWIAAMAGIIRQGAMILIDYGHEAKELYAPHRMNGTLQCYKDHIAHEDPFVSIGEQDITSHVNFTACMRAAKASGWQISYYDTQKRFLVDQGVLDDLIAHDGRNPFGDEARRNRAIAQLLLGNGMSETFKVLVLRKE